jgi:bacterioferritin (cytochrome b1)
MPPPAAWSAAGRGILKTMVHGEEEQIDWLETQPETIAQTGLENYLAEQIHGD